jgi:uncharacterized membrane protein (UPF0127 family)
MNTLGKNVLYVTLGILFTIALLFFVVRTKNTMSYKTNKSLVLPTTGSFTLPHMTFQLVTTLAEQEKGLGGRAYIEPNYGMLFVFEKMAIYGFWMKDMLVPIDIIWLSDTGTVVQINASVSPETYPEIFRPTVPVKYVLETAAGESARLGWIVGSSIQLPLPYGK